MISSHLIFFLFLFLGEAERSKKKKAHNPSVEIEKVSLSVLEANVSNVSGVDQTYGDITISEDSSMNESINIEAVANRMRGRSRVALAQRRETALLSESRRQSSAHLLKNISLSTTKDQTYANMSYSDDSSMNESLQGQVLAQAKKLKSKKRKSLAKAHLETKELEREENREPSSLKKETDAVMSKKKNVRRSKNLTFAELTYDNLGSSNLDTSSDSIVLESGKFHRSKKQKRLPVSLANVDLASVVSPEPKSSENVTGNDNALSSAAKTSESSPKDKLSLTLSSESPEGSPQKKLPADSPKRSLSNQLLSESRRSPQDQVLEGSPERSPSNKLSTENPDRIPHSRVVTEASRSLHKVFEGTPERSLHMVPEESPRRSPRHVVPEESPRRSPRHMVSEETPRKSPRHLVSEESPRRSPRYVVSEESPRKSPRHLVSEESPRRSPRHLVSEESPRRSPRYVVSEESPRKSPHHLVSEESPRRSPRHMVSEETPRKSPHHLISEESPRRSPRHLVSEETPRKSPHHLVSEESPRRSPRHLVSEESLRRSVHNTVSEKSPNKSPLRKVSEDMKGLPNKMMGSLLVAPGSNRSRDMVFDTSAKSLNLTHDSTLRSVVEDQRSLHGKLVDASFPAAERTNSTSKEKPSDITSSDLSSLMEASSPGKIRDASVIRKSDILSHENRNNSMLEDSLVDVQAAKKLKSSHRAPKIELNFSSLLQNLREDSVTEGNEEMEDQPQNDKRKLDEGEEESTDFSLESAVKEGVSQSVDKEVHGVVGQDQTNNILTPPQTFRDVESTLGKSPSEVHPANADMVSDTSSDTTDISSNISKALMSLDEVVDSGAEIVARQKDASKKYVRSIDDEERLQENLPDSLRKDLSLRSMSDFHMTVSPRKSFRNPSTVDDQQDKVMSFLHQLNVNDSASADPQSAANVLFESSSSPEMMTDLTERTSPSRSLRRSPRKTSPQKGMTDLTVKDRLPAGVHDSLSQVSPRKSLSASSVHYSPRKSFRDFVGKVRSERDAVKSVLDNKEENLSRKLSLGMSHGDVSLKLSLTGTDDHTSEALVAGSRTGGSGLPESKESSQSPSVSPRKGKGEGNTSGRRSNISQVPDHTESLELDRKVSASRKRRSSTKEENLGLRTIVLADDEIQHHPEEATKALRNANSLQDTGASGKESSVNDDQENNNILSVFRISEGGKSSDFASVLSKSLPLTEGQSGLPTEDVAEEDTSVGTVAKLKRQRNKNVSLPLVRDLHQQKQILDGNENDDRMPFPKNLRRDLVDESSNRNLEPVTGIQVVGSLGTTLSENVEVPVFSSESSNPKYVTKMDVNGVQAKKGTDIILEGEADLQMNDRTSSGHSNFSKFSVTSKLASDVSSEYSDDEEELNLIPVTVTRTQEKSLSLSENTANVSRKHESPVASVWNEESDDDDDGISAATASTSKLAESDLRQTTMGEFLKKLAAKPPNRSAVYNVKESQEKVKELLRGMQSSEIKKQVVLSKGIVPEKKKKKVEGPPKSVPLSVTKEIFTHFAKCRVNKEVMEGVFKVSQTFWKHMSHDLVNLAHSRSGGYTIEKEDVVQLMKRSDLLDDDTSLQRLIEEYLPAEEWEVLIPTRYGHNNVFPPPPE